MVARRIYWAILIFSLIIGVYVYGIAPHQFDTEFLLFFSLIPFFMFAGSVHGILVHALRPSVKGDMITYPIMMGLLFALLFFIHVFVIVPLVCPNLF